MLLWFLLLFPQEETKTAHYDLRIETLDAADVGRMLESLHAQPWRIVWTGWQQRGEAIEGRSETNGIVVLKRSPESLRAEMEVLEGLMKAGLVFGFRSADDFWIAQIVGERQVRVLHRVNGEWAILEEKTVVAAVGLPSLRLTRTASGIRVTANGEVVGEFEAEGDFGLNVEACRVYFRIR